MENLKGINGYGKFAIGNYCQIMKRMLIKPGRFFSDISNGMSFTQPLGCLIISCLFFTGASLTQIGGSNVLIAGILFLNAIVMPIIAAGVTFIVINSLMVKVTFLKLLSVYFYAASVTLLLSWIPKLIWLTEPWKWVLVYKGLTIGCGLKRIKTIMIIGITISVLTIFFGSLGLGISYLKGLA